MNEIQMDDLNLDGLDLDSLDSPESLGFKTSDWKKKKAGPAPKTEKNVFEELAVLPDTDVSHNFGDISISAPPAKPVSSNVFGAENIDSEEIAQNAFKKKGIEVGFIPKDSLEDSSGIKVSVPAVTPDAPPLPLKEAEVSSELNGINPPVLEEMDGAPANINTPNKIPALQKTVNRSAAPVPPLSSDADAFLNSLSPKARERMSRGFNDEPIRVTAFSMSPQANSGAVPSYGRQQTSGSDNMNRNNLLEIIEKERMEKYRNGKRKADVIGGITIASGVLTLISAFSENSFFVLAFTMIIGVITIIYAVRFMNGDDRARRNLGIFNLIDFMRTGHSLLAIAAFSSSPLLSMLEGLGLLSVIIAINVICLIVYGVLAYLFLLDKSVTDFTNMR